MDIEYAVNDGFELKDSTRKFIEEVFEYSLDHLGLRNRKGLIYVLLEETARKEEKEGTEYETYGSVIKLAGFYLVRISVKGRPKISLAETIGHEMTHVEQMERGDLRYWKPEGAGQTFPEIRIWKNKPVPSNDSLTHQEYLDLEFEVEARRVGLDIAIDYTIATAESWVDRFVLKCVKWLRRQK